MSPAVAKPAPGQTCPRWDRDAKPPDTAQLPRPPDGELSAGHRRRSTCRHAKFARPHEVRAPACGAVPRGLRPVSVSAGMLTPPPVSAPPPPAPPGPGGVLPAHPPPPAAGVHPPGAAGAPQQAPEAPLGCSSGASTVLRGSPDRRTGPPGPPQALVFRNPTEQLRGGAGPSQAHAVCRGRAGTARKSLPAAAQPTAPPGTLGSSPSPGTDAWDGPPGSEATHRAGSLARTHLQPVFQYR